MKCKFFLSLFAAALVQSSPAQTALFYVNDGVVQAPPGVPPNIDAVNFVNNNLFELSLGSFSLFLNSQPFYTANTLNYTNFGTIVSDMGFNFSTYAPEADFSQQFRPAASFYNSGTILSGSTFGGGFFFGENSRLLIRSTNIVNPGSLESAENGLINITGDDVDLNHGTITMMGQAGFNNILDSYWGLGTNGWPLANGFNDRFAFTPVHDVTNRNNFYMQQALFLANGAAYELVSALGDSNNLTQVVFLANASTQTVANVYLSDTGPITVEFAWTNPPYMGMPETPQYFYIEDNFGMDDDHELIMSGFGPQGPTFTPINYSFFSTSFQFPGLPAPAVPGLTVQFPAGNITNLWTAYELLLEPTSTTVTGVVGRNPTNMPGRIEITANKRLDLRDARISGANTLVLTSTNEALFDGAEIAVPLANINLRSTTRDIVIQKLLAPTLPLPQGTISLWSAKWSDVTDGVTNSYHVLFVDAQFSPFSEPSTFDVRLSADNIVIHDALNIQRFALFDSKSLTIATNPPGTFPATGEINLESGVVLWSSATPRLSWFTNYGVFTAQNAVYFGGTRTSPYYSTTFNEPYEVFINGGLISVYGATIYSRYFENTGLFTSVTGSIVMDATTGLFVGGSVIAPEGDVNLKASTLVISNTLMTAGRQLTLNVSSYLDDGGVDSGNFWVIGDSSSSVPGLILPVKPGVANLLGTTITNIAPPHATFRLSWAGQDLGATSAGYFNNAAVKHMVFDARNDRSVFNISAANGVRALYVQTLELQNFATNLNALGNFTALNVLPGMKLYFGQAFIGGTDVSDMLNGANGGRILRVSDAALAQTALVYTNPAPVIVTRPAGSVGTSTGGETVTTTTTGHVQYPIAPTAGTASVVAEATGNYYGLFHPSDDVNPANSGYLYLTLSSRKTFSGKVLHGKSIYSFSGALGSGSQSEVNVKRSDIQLKLKFVDNDKLVGSVTINGVDSEIHADRNTFNRTNPYQGVGYYTFHLNPEDGVNPAQAPAGVGYGYLTVDRYGIVKWSAVLADGTKASGQTGLSAERVFPLYSSLYSGKGILIGWMQFNEDYSEVVGAPAWNKQSGAVSRTYTAGFDVELDVTGSKYVRPANNERVLKTLTSTTINFDDPTSETPITVTASIEPNNRTKATFGQISMSISQSTGVFRGNVKDPSSGLVLPFGGILDRGVVRGAGYFFKDKLSGPVAFGN